MSWLFSRALVEESSEANCSDGALSAQSRTTPTQQAYLWRGKTMESWSPFPSGMTCEHLTERHGEELLTSFLEASRAKISAVPERGQVSTDQDQVSGKKWRALSVKFDLASCSWRTAHCSSNEDLPWSSVILPRWGMMRSGECWERETPEPPTNGIDSGYWVPTPTVGDSRSAGSRNTATSKAKPGTSLTDWARGDGGTGRQDKENGGKLNPQFAEWLMGWPVGWAAYEPLEMDKFQQWQQQHSDFSWRSRDDESTR
jgi:hypothetical protein